MPDWFEDEAFWDKLYPFLFTDRKLEAAEAEVESVLELAGIHQGDVLDLACGPGRHSVALAKKELRVTGVDLSSVLLRRARERGLADNVDVEWVQEDMRRFVRPESFDLAISLFTSFGYFESRDDDLRGPAEHPGRAFAAGEPWSSKRMGREPFWPGDSCPTTLERARRRQAAGRAPRGGRRLDLASGTSGSS